MKKIKIIILCFICFVFRNTAYSQSDDCGVAAPTLTPGSSCNNVAGATNGTFTDSGFGCAGGDEGDDGWYKFVATAITHTVIINGNVGFDTEVGVYVSCSGATVAGGGCTNATGDGGIETLSLSGLTIGSTYYIKLHDRDNDAGGSFNICITSPIPPPANDNCSGATAFPTVPTNGSCTTLTNQTTLGASNSNVTPTGACTSNPVTPDDDVWFSFVASTTSHSLVATYVSGSTDVYWQVFSGACAGTMTSLLCTDNDAGGLINGLTIGQTYFVRLYTWGTGVSTVQNICISSGPPAPANDNCAGAIAFPTIPTTGACATLTNQSTTSASNSNVTPTGACTTNTGTPDDDIWFSFVASSTSQVLSGTYVSGATDVYWQVFSSSCGATMTSVLCTDNNSGGLITGLTIGNTYYVRLYTNAIGAITTQNICISAPLVNDNCSGATAFPAIPTNGSCATLTNQSTAGATNSGVTPTGSCTTNSGTPDDDVWFSFVATNAVHILTGSYVSGVSDVYWQVFSSACGSSMTSILCTDNNSGGTLTGLTIGNTYYIRLYTWGSGSNTTQNICIAGPPPNNNCSGAIAFPTIPTTGACATLSNQTTAGSSNSSVTPTGVCTSNLGSPDDDVWFSFVATGTIQFLSGSYVSGSSDVYWQVFSGACSSTMTAILCTDNDAGGTLSGLTIGNTYYVRLYTWGSGNNTTQNICISGVPPPPPNDEPCSATTASVNAGFTCSVTTAGTLSGATASSYTNVCAGSADDDVWFSFIANNASQSISFQNVAGSTTDLYHSVYGGACSALGSTLICSDPNSSVVTGLTVGSTYLVRVFSQTPTPYQNTTFNLCIIPTPPVPTNTICATQQPVCSGSPIVFQASANSGTAAAGPNYGCLTTKPNPTWFYLEIANPGTMAIDITANSDIDFAMWGPYPSLAAGQASCSSYPTPLDCSYSGSATEQMNIANAIAGEVYVLLVTNYANTSQIITLNQASGAEATTNCAIVTTPIELVNFLVTPTNDKRNILDWITATETNNDYFEIQRSSNAYNWITIGTQKGGGNSVTLKSYQFIDNEPFNETTYYRLKQIDFDKTFTYSKVVSVDMASLPESISNLHPNPTKDIVNFDWKASKKDNIIIELLDYKGEVVYNDLMQTEEGINSLMLDVSEYRNGIYLLKITSQSNGKSSVYKILKL